MVCCFLCALYVVFEGLRVLFPLFSLLVCRSESVVGFWSGESFFYRTDNTVNVWLNQRMAPSRCMRACVGGVKVD